jgi:hypothetical protein
MAFVDEDGSFDCTGDIGPLFPRPNVNPVTCPMYSFERPAFTLWNAIGAGLHAKGWTEEQIRWWFQSKAARHHFDGALGEALEQIGKEYAKKVHAEDHGYVQNEMKGG